MKRIKRENWKLLFIVFLISCQVKPKNEAMIQHIKPSTVTQNVTPPVTTVENKENSYSILYSDSLKFNQVGFETKVEEFLKVMGQPDSIIDPAYDCGYFESENVPVQVYYYSGSSFNVYHGGVEIRTINFTKCSFVLDYPGLSLSLETTLEDIKKHFPASSKASYVLKDDTDGRQYTYVRFWPREKVDDQIVLKFFEGRLVELELWMPC